MEFQIRMSLKMQFHSKWDVTQNRLSLKKECHSKLNVTQHRTSLKWNATQNAKSHNM